MLGGIMTRISVIKMDPFMMNKRCPGCDANVFVVKKRPHEDAIWYCAKCERKLLKEVDVPKPSFWKRLLGRT